LFFVLLTIAILNGHFFNELNNNIFHFKTPKDNGLSDIHVLMKFAIIVILAPFFETFFFNYLPIYILKRITPIKNKKYLLVLLPSILFACFHFYNPLYPFMALFGGLIMNYYFLKLDDKTNKAFWSVAILHASYNLYGYLFVN
jgi:membrane protease YdiL (CAAX protease family)